MVRKLFNLLLLLVVFILKGSAQTIQWLVKPEFDTICYLNSFVFKCKKGEKVQLINFKGRELLVPLADSVTNYCENRALVLDKIDDRFRIRGIVDEYGVVTSVYDDFFTNDYSFYSDSLLSVEGKSNKSGYLDINGNLTIPCKYRMARPFIQGWASVEPAKGKQQTIYINAKEKKLKIRGFHEGKVVMGSSFNSSGEALVTFFNNDNAVINTRGEVTRKYEKTDTLIPIRKYDFSFDESGKNYIPDDSPEISYETDYLPFVLNNLFGYRKEDHVLAPAQFSHTDRFVKGCAIVGKKNKYGVVKLIEGSFSGEFVGDEIIVADGKQASTYTYNLIIPKNLKPEELEVMFDTGDGNYHSVIIQDEKYEFIPHFEDNADVCEMRMQVISNGLILWSDSLEKNVSNVNIDISLPEAITERADERDIFRVRSVITNNSESSVIVSGYYSANFAKNSQNGFGQKKSFWHKMEPKSQKEIFADIIVVEEEYAKVFIWVIVNKKPFGSKSSVIQFKPFY